MTEFFDTRKIRDDQEHWDSMAARVAQTAAARAGRSGGMVAFAASTSGWIAATLLTGVAVGVMLVSRMVAADGAVSEWDETIRPADNIGATITASANPPSIGALLLNATGTGSPR